MSLGRRASPGSPGTAASAAAAPVFSTGSPRTWSRASSTSCTASRAATRGVRPMPNAAGATFQELPWPRVRELVTDALTAGHRAHLAHGFVEFDVSLPMARIEEYKPLVPGGVSFTAYLVYCL